MELPLTYSFFMSHQACYELVNILNHFTPELNWNLEIGVLQPAANL